MKNMKNLLLGTLVSSSLTVGALADEPTNSTYFGIKTGTLSFDKTIIANTSGMENVGPYTAYKEVKLSGIEIGSLNTTESGFVYGLSFDVLFNEGELVNGGMLNFDAKLGKAFDKLKVYGIFGISVQSLSDYTVASGAYNGIGATYDITDSVALRADYTSRSLKTTSDAEGDDIADSQTYKATGLMVGVALKF